MKFKLICLMLLGMCSLFINADEEPVYVDIVTVKHIEGHKYSITVSGNAPNPGYSNIRLVPYTYMAAPKSWEIIVLSDAPKSGGMMIQVLKPYSVSLEHTFPESVKSITIVGRTKQVEKKLVITKVKVDPIPVLVPTKTLEVLYGIKLKGNSVVISVQSNGCTKKSDFTVTLDPKSFEIAIYRTTPDYCEMVPHIVDLTFSKKELGLNNLKKFGIKNRFSLQMK